MNQRIRGIAAIAALLTMLGPTGNGAEGGTISAEAAVWVSHMRECLKKVFSIRAEFVQERKDKQKETSDEWRGILELRRGGRYRLAYEAPQKRLVISDGVTVWAYDQAAKIAYTHPANDTLVDRFLALISAKNYQKYFNIDYLGGAAFPRDGGFGAIELTPTEKHPFIASLVLSLNNRCPCVRRVLVTHHDGSVTRLTLSKVRFNVGIGARRFRFTPPRGTQIVTP